jgi:hypothetical protein
VFRIRIDRRRFDAELGTNLDRHNNGDPDRHRQQNFPDPQLRPLDLAKK